MSRLFGYAGLLLTAVLLPALITGSLVLRLLAVLIGLAIVGFYRFLQRSLPPRSGALFIEGLREPVEVFRDDRGVPHVYARNFHDLNLAQGYVTAQDRLWQLEVARRAAAGRLAEVFGEGFLERDRHLRTVGLQRVAEASLEEFSPEARRQLEAYAAGINAFLKGGRLPPEFALLGLKPEPWRPVDSIAVSKLLAYELGNNWADQLFHAHLVQTVGAEKAAALCGCGPDPSAVEALFSLPQAELDQLFGLAVSNLGTVSGSNGWVVAGSRTNSGLPLLGSDLHTAPQIPTAWYQVHLVGPDRLDVTGISIPGLPGAVMGHTRDFAWALSSVSAETQELVVERLNPAAPDEVAGPDGYEKATRIVEEIRVRGQAAPVRHEVLITRRGPVLVSGEEMALVLRSTVLQPSAEIESLLQINRARNWREVGQAAERFRAPVQALLFAGRDGTIARKVIGAIPIRPAGHGHLPAAGWSEDHEWTGFLPADLLPESVNPDEGFLVAANQDLTPAGSPHRIASPWSLPYRAERLAERLRGASDLTRDRGEAIQADTVNLQARNLLQLLLGILNEGLRQGVQPESLNETEKRALLMISGWDYDEADTSPAALLWQQWYAFLLEEIFRPQMGLALFDQFVASSTAIPVADRLLAQVAAGDESLWLGREGESGLPRLALRSFRRAAALLAAKHGPRPDNWQWGKEHKVRFVHPLSTRFRWMARFLDLGPHPVGGSPTTVAHNSFSLLNPFGVNFAATYRRVVDMGLPEEGVDISAPGASGHPLSPFFADQFITWQKGGYAPQPMRHPEIRKFPRLLLSPVAHKDI